MPRRTLLVTEQPSCKAFICAEVLGKAAGRNQAALWQGGI